MDEEYDVLDSFIRKIRKRYPKISDAGCHLELDVLQAEYIDFRFPEKDK